MKTIVIQGGLLAPLLVGLMFLCAMYTPWWGTPVVVGVMACIPGLRARVIAPSALAGWFLACVVRDMLSDFGPSRVFTRFLSLETVGLGIDSIEARLAVYTMTSVIGFALASLVVGAVRFSQSFARSFVR